MAFYLIIHECLLLLLIVVTKWSQSQKFIRTVSLQLKYKNRIPQVGDLSPPVEKDKQHENKHKNEIQKPKRG